MKRTQVICVVSVFAGLMSGCLAADQHLPANMAPSVDSPYVGFWQSPWPAMQTRDTLNVSFVPGWNYFAAVRGRGKYFGRDDRGEPIETQETMTYEAYPSRIGDRMFFSLHPSKNESGVTVVIEAVLKDGGKTLVIREPSDQAVEQGMQEGKLSWRMEEDSRVVTSSPEVLAIWLSSLGDADFANEQVFERWPRPINDLVDKLGKVT